jgi:hypothetical protein
MFSSNAELFNDAVVDLTFQAQRFQPLESLGFANLVYQFEYINFEGRGGRCFVTDALRQTRGVTHGCVYLP